MKLFPLMTSQLVKKGRRTKNISDHVISKDENPTNSNTFNKQFSPLLKAAQTVTALLTIEV